MKMLPDETPELAAAVPAKLLAGLRAYGLDHVKTGGFLYTVLCNDLHGAIMRADPESLASIRPIMEYVFNALPSTCWGSKEIVQAWLAAKGAAQ